MEWYQLSCNNRIRRAHSFGIYPARLGAAFSCSLGAGNDDSCRYSIGVEFVLVALFIGWDFFPCVILEPRVADYEGEYMGRETRLSTMIFGKYSDDPKPPHSVLSIAFCPLCSLTK